MKNKLTLSTGVKQFVRDYRLPLAATLVFVVLIAFLSVVRFREHVALGQIFAVRNAAGNDYASLLSNDKQDDFSKRDVSADDRSIVSSNSNPTSAANSVTTSTLTTSSTAPSTATTSAGPTTTPGTTPVTPQPFTAGIADFKQDQAASLQCPSGLLGGININKCSKVYSFAANVQTANGPGTVKYEWRYSVSGSSNGSFVAASGTNTTTLHSQVTISCKDPGSFTAQFALTSPQATQSGTQQISHSC